MKYNADVIIVGGGIVGTSTAYYLAKKGQSVIVLEGSDVIGNGGSSRNGGGVRQSGRDKRELPLMMYGTKNIWPTLSEELGIDVEYYQEGNLRLGKTEEHLKILDTLASNARSVGLNVSMVTGDEARAICPYLSNEIIGASWCPTDGHANPMMATLAYYTRSRELGVSYYTGKKVVSLSTIKGKIRKVHTLDGEVFEGETVIVAAGLESRKILASVGVDIPMTPYLLEALVTEAQPPMFYQMLGTAMADFYGHQTKHGSFVFGGSAGLEPYFKDNGTPVTTSITAPYICRGVLKYFPMLGNAKIVRTWAGWVDMCADKVPVISFIDEIPGLIVACGFSSHGFGIGPAVGYQLAEMASETVPTIDLQELHYNRFKAKA